MAHRDYKDSEPRRGGRSKSNRKGGNPAKAVLFVLLVGLVLAGIILWKVWPRPGDFRAVSSAPTVEPAPARSKEEAAPPVEAQPNAKTGTSDKAADYTFYDILPGNKAPLPADKRPEQWWLQVAALKNASDADALRAKLAMLNFSAIVQPTPAGQPPLFRVRVGPYQHQADAEAAQKTLAENKFDSRPLKEAVTP
ncbi:MAG TPA: SPOR domain-containing protein [Parasulfuritortus sp.]